VYVVPVRTGVYYGRPMLAGYIYRIAGNHTSIDSGDGGPAAAAGFDSVSDVTVDRLGDVIVRASNRVRMIAARTGTAYGQALQAGSIYTLAGGGTDGIDGTARAATSVALAYPLRLAADRDGNVVLTQDFGYYGGCVAVLAAAAGTYYGRTLPAGDLARVDGTGRCAGTGATPAPVSVATDGRGNIVFGEINDYGYATPRVQLLAGSAGVYYGVAVTGGTVATVAGGNQDGFSGDGGPALAAQLGGVWDLAVDGSNTLDIVDGPNYRLRDVVDR
jgi:hypothetical protein